MDKAKVMRDYNKYERQATHSINGETVTTQNLVKFVSNDSYGSYISYFEHDEQQAREEIAQQLSFYRQRKLNFEWKTYTTDSPSNMDELLLEHGFEQAETESFMALDLESVEIREIDDSLLAEVSDEQGIRDAITVQEQVWGGEFDWQFNYLLNLKSQTPEAVSIYVIYQEGKPVTSAWLTFNGDSPFAGIWGGSTVKEHRGKGYYSLLLNKRISEAKQRGKKYLIIDASDMSRPIVEKHGFEFIASTTGYNSPE